jgi:cell division protein FtsL
MKQIFNTKMEKALFVIALVFTIISYFIGVYIGMKYY